MDKNVGVLELLRQMRERELEAATGRLAQQQQLCQRYASNINALTNLSASSSTQESDAAQLHNQARFKASIQRVIEWQKQEQALAKIREEALQQELVEQACREKSLSLILERQRAAQQQYRQQWEQKQTDDQAMQSWLRGRRNGE